jgi:LDH2 family malate/lactate/ureidoglycolate dehydrogenase
MARAARIANGIDIDDTTWAQLAAIAERYQIRVEG